MLFTRSAMDLLAFIPLLLLAILPIGSGSPFSMPTITSDVTVIANSTAMLTHCRLMPRQCEFDGAESKFVCDEFLPSLKEMVDRMRDPKEQGLVDSSHHVAFFTGLNIEMVPTGILIAGWFKSRSTAEKPLHFCWCEDCIDQIWFGEQNLWIEHSTAARTHPDEWGDDPQHDFLACYFQALALAVVNPDVYVFAPKDLQWQENSAWVQYGECIHPVPASRTKHQHILPFQFRPLTALEYWALTRNPNVRRIWRVDPRDVRENQDLSDGEKCQYNDPVIEWDRDNGGQALPAKMYCRIKYDTEGEPWVSWGPPPVLSNAPPPDEPESPEASSTA